ncbi:MAG: HAD family hydrolase [Candidatus Saccharibacteria bacterium]
MKKIIFFDGDGTLWEPPKHKNYAEPWHIYADEEADPFTEMQAVPIAHETLEAIGKLGIKRVLLSTSPLPPKEALVNRKQMVLSMGLDDVLDEIQFAPEYPEGKSERIIELLASHGFKKSDALMVGDMYKWDYKPAQDIEVDALLIERDYSYKWFENDHNAKTIKLIAEVLDYLE